MSEPVVEVPVTARIPEADKASLEALAAKADRSRSAEVRRAIREYIERELEQAA
jgi:predicted transcriptional regulator